MIKLQSSINIDSFEKGPIRRSLFTNGATSLFHEAKGFVGAKVNLYFLAGSIFEKDGEHGTAHLIEHMLFKESQSDYISELEANGAEINAYTYKEYVCFEMECLGYNIDTLLPKFLNLFFNLDYTSNEFLKEKEVIVQELKEDKDDQETEGLEYIIEKNFGPAIGHPVGGVISDVKSLSEKTMNDFYNNFFTADRMILTIVSGSESNSFEKIYLAAMNKKFPHNLKKPFRLNAKNKISSLTQCKSNLKRKMESSIIFFSFNGPSLNSSMYYEYAILDEILFEGMSSLYFKNLRQIQPLVYGLDSTMNSFQKEGSYVMVFHTQTKNIKLVKKEVLASLTQMPKEYFNEDRVEMIKKRLLDNWELSFDSLADRAEYISDCEIYNLDEISLSKVKAKIEKVNLKSITNIVNNIIKSGYSELIMSSK